jgi:hypothetical protein
MGMLTDQRRLTVLWLLRPVAALAILLPVIVWHNDPMSLRWYVAGAGVAGSFAISAYHTVLKNRIRRKEAPAERTECRRLIDGGIFDVLWLSAFVRLFFCWRDRRASKVHPQSPAPRL